MVHLTTGKAYRNSFTPATHVKKPLVTGDLYIDMGTSALVELSYQLSPKHKKYLKTNRNWKGNKLSTAPSVKKIVLMDECKTIKYRPYQDQWFLSSIIQDIDFTAEVKLPVKTIAESKPLRLHLEQVVSSISREIMVKNTQEIPTDLYYYQVYLKNNLETYDSASWDKYSAIQTTIKYGRIVTELNKLNNSLSTN